MCKRWINTTPSNPLVKPSDAALTNALQVQPVPSYREINSHGCICFKDPRLSRVFCGKHIDDLSLADPLRHETGEGRQLVRKLQSDLIDPG